jgi:hypothetical protein
MGQLSSYRCEVVGRNGNFLLRLQEEVGLGDVRKEVEMMRSECGHFVSGQGLTGEIRRKEVDVVALWMLDSAGGYGDERIRRKCTCR